jgi:hypothetical protein
MTIIPAGTRIYAPDGIHRVTLQFANENDAIVFYEWVLSLDADLPQPQQGNHTN